MKRVPFAVFCLVLLLASSTVFAQNIVVFSDSGFPPADSASPQQVGNLLPGARLASVDQLSGLLASPSTALLVLPYGSAFPEQAWPDIHQFLQRGGNLLVLGGRPFSRSVFHDDAGWHLRDYNVRFMRALMIDQYQETPGSDGMAFEANPDMPLQLPRFTWKRAFSPVIRLSAVDLYKRGGA